MNNGFCMMLGVGRKMVLDGVGRRMYFRYCQTARMTSSCVLSGAFERLV